MLFYCKVTVPSSMLPPEQMHELQLKTLDYLLSLKKSGKLLFGGLRAGVKSAILIFDVESHNELDKLLLSIPLFSLFSESEVYPLNSIEERRVIVEDSRKLLGHE